MSAAEALNSGDRTEWVCILADIGAAWYGLPTKDYRHAVQAYILSGSTAEAARTLGWRKRSYLAVLNGALNLMSDKLEGER